MTAESFVCDAPAGYAEKKCQPEVLEVVNSLSHRFDCKRFSYRARAVGILLVVSLSAFPARAAEDDFASLYRYMIDANKAQVVMLSEEKLIPEPLARRLAAALEQVADEGVPEQGGARYPDYLALEARLKQLVGDEASNIHLGRSRNDLGAVMNLMLMRQHLLGLSATLADLRRDLQSMAAEHVDTVMPGYTHGVQAQPTTLGHFLLSVDAGFGRDADRFRAAYDRINRSPLGSGAFTTSGFELDRERLADLLGFPALAENSYDAIMLNPADTKVELGAVLSQSALTIGRLAQYILFQYDDPAPGLLLSDDVTGRSSIMPQKRSPSIVERLRLDASEVVGRAHLAALMVHNTPLYEVKDARQDHLYRLNDMVAAAHDMYDKLSRVLGAMTIRRDFLLSKVDADYSTMTELADTLKREADVPFRVGHEVASKLTTYGRSAGKTPAQLTHREVAAVYREVVGEDYPLTPSQTKAAFSAEAFVRSRRGIGGPQSAEMARMLGEHRGDLAGFREWVQGEMQRLDEAAKALDAEFDRLAGAPAS